MVGCHNVLEVVTSRCDEKLSLLLSVQALAGLHGRLSADVFLSRSKSGQDLQGDAET